MPVTAALYGGFFGRAEQVALDTSDHEFSEIAAFGEQCSAGQMRGSSHGCDDSGWIHRLGFASGAGLGKMEEGSRSLNGADMGF